MIPQDILDLLNNLTIFTLAILVGFAVISKVPATLHTPLMSGANSIHGIVLVGAMLIAAEVNDVAGYVLALVAVGVRDDERRRRLRRHRPDAPDVPEEARGPEARRGGRGGAGRNRWIPSATSKSSSGSCGSRAPSASSSAWSR